MARMKRRVLIVGSDEHAAFVSSAVARAGGTPVALDPLQVPSAPLSFSSSSAGSRADWLRARVDDVAAVSVKSLPFSPLLPTASELLMRDFSSGTDRYTAAREVASFVPGGLQALADGGVLVVNPPSSFAWHVEK